MKEYQKDPDWPRLRASMYVTRNMPEKALDSIRDAIQLSQGQPQRILPLMQDYLNILARLKKYRDLLAECNQLLTNADLAKSSWWVYQMRGIAYAYSDGKRADAINDFDKALEIAGRLKSDDAVAVIIQSIADTIGVDRAIERCEREAAKGDNHWRVILTYLYLTNKEYRKAEDTIELVLNVEPGKLNAAEKEAAYGVAGSVYMLTAHFEKARDVYEKLLEQSPEDTVSLNNLACIWAESLDKPDPVKALTYSSKALEVMNKRGITDPNIMDTHGWVLVCSGQPAKGVDFLRVAIDKKPMMETYYHLGMALLKQNSGIDAQLQFDRAHKMLEEKKAKSQPTDAKFEAHLNDAMVKAKQLINGTPATAPVSSGTGAP
jgi:tetratricopeptide (TPR) repeat protein